MKAYAVLIEEEQQAKEDALLFVEAEDARERYAIPSAFERYADYMNIKIGSRAVRQI